MTASYRKICVVGPGAIGGMMAVMLSRAGYEVSTLARPERAARIAARGITLLSRGETFTARPRVASDAAELGPQDLVIVTLKSSNLRETMPQVMSLCGPDTPLVFLMNGVPWWFFHGAPGPHAGANLSSVDPDGFLGRTVPLSRIVWGTIDAAVEAQPNETVRHLGGARIVLGRPDNALTGLEDIAVVFRAAQYVVEITPQIRDAIWCKLLGNVAFNPVSALTLALVADIMSDPLLDTLVSAVMEEARAVGRKLGLPVEADILRQLRQREPSSLMLKTSMYQDMERGRPLELDALATVVTEIADMTGVPVPFLKTVLGLLRTRVKSMAAS